MKTNYSDIKNADLTNLLIKINELFIISHENGITCDWCKKQYDEKNIRGFHDKFNGVKLTICNDCFDFRQTKLELRRILYDIIYDKNVSQKQKDENKYYIIKNCSDCRYYRFAPRKVHDCNIDSCAIYKENKRCETIINNIISDDIIKFKTALTKIKLKIKNQKL